MGAFDLNVRSAINAVQASVPLAGNEPVIVSISTAAIHIAPISQAVAYTASKLASYKVFEYLAAEDPELHIVRIQPGLIATEIDQDMVDVDRDRRKYLYETNLGDEKVLNAAPQVNFQEPFMSG